MGAMAFVVGTGRSGTNWLGRTLDEHPAVRATLEQQPIFGLATEAAVDPRVARRNLRLLRALYTWQRIRSGRRLYVDKSHPNLWHAQTLAGWFPRSRFVAMRRDPFGTVASMMKHDGVLSWQRRWREFPVPNRFLGITAEMAETYDDLPVAAQCALRWKAHSDRVDEIASAMPERVLVVEYADMIADCHAQADRLWAFLEVVPQPLVGEVETESLTRWREELTDGDVDAIRSVVDA